MTTLEEWRSGRSTEGLKGNLEEAKKLRAEAKLKLIQDLTKDLQVTEAMARRVADVT